MKEIAVEGLELLEIQFVVAVFVAEFDGLFGNLREVAVDEVVLLDRLEALNQVFNSKVAVLVLIEHLEQEFEFLVLLVVLEAGEDFDEFLEVNLIVKAGQLL